MFTSNYSKHSHYPNAISIAGKAPEWYKGKEYKKLAPKYWFFKKFKDPTDEHYHDVDFYIKNYNKEVLNTLDAKEVLEEMCELLGIEYTPNPDIILLCWESKPKESMTKEDILNDIKYFCHRHLVAEWFESKLGIKILEI